MAIESPSDEWTIPAPKSSQLQAMYWRSEILQVMYWLRGEGFGDLVDAQLIEQFLQVEANRAVGYLDRLVVEGYLTIDGAWYALSARGLEQGALDFLEAFSELMRPGHGECSADCWCHMSVDEADACVAHRREHDHR